MDPTPSWNSRFRGYFEREVAQLAARTLADGAQVELRIRTSGGDVLETFHFIRVAGKNEVREGAAPVPQVIFSLTPAAAEEVLSDPAEEIAMIGIAIMKLLVSTDANRRISLQTKAGFVELFTRGYFGVLATGGQKFAAHLASLGLTGVGSLKNKLKNLRG